MAPDPSSVYCQYRTRHIESIFHISFARMIRWRILEVAGMLWILKFCEQKTVRNSKGRRVGGARDEVREGTSDSRRDR